RAMAEADREIKGEPHADRHALAMQQAIAKAAGSFERMAEGVAEIEERALAVFALVGRDDARLGSAAARDRLLAKRRIAGDERRAMGFEPVVKIAIADKRIFDHFGISRAQFACGQC